VTRRLSALRSTVARAHATVEDKPLAVVLLAAGATVGVVVALAAEAGWPRVLRVVRAEHSWGWLVVCAIGEVVAYGGYVLTVRDMARVHDGSEIDLPTSAQTVVAGFGVFAATRSSGGFAVDYWAFRKSGASRREAVRRVLGLGLLEYVTLSLAALVASLLLMFGLDGHLGLGGTLPGLIILPAAALGYWLTTPGRAQRLAHPRRDAGTVRKKFADWVGAAVFVRRLLTSPAEHGAGVVGNAIYWTGDIVCLWAALQLVNVSISWSLLVLAYSGGYVLTRRALPVGGAGVVEVALTWALVGVGVNFAPALNAVLVYRLFNFWLPIVPALALMPAVRDLRQRFERAEQTA